MSAVPIVPERQARILIVDDERHNRQVLEVMLGSEGFVLQTAAGGEEALMMVAREPPDLVLLDVMMPGMDGFEVATRIKGDPATRHILVIMVTALDDRASRLQGLDAGAEDFVSKPINRAELRVRVRNLLRLKAYGDYHDRYSHLLEDQVGSRTAELIASERLYRETFDEAPVGIVHVGLDGQWLRVNQRLCDLVGYTRPELLTPAIQATIEPRDTASRADLLEQVSRGATPGHVVGEERYRRRDGSALWVKASMSLHCDVQGQPRHFILVIQDITKRRALEDEVRQSMLRLGASEQRYRMLLDGASDAIAVLTPEGIVREMNQRWLDITGLPREQLVGRHMGSFVVAGAEADLAAEHGADQDRHPTTSEIARADGSTILMEFSRTSIELMGEALVLTIGRDITRQRQLEEQLRQAQKLEVVGQLASGIAHDFNNILTAIVGFSEIAMADLGAEHPSCGDLVEIKSSGLRAAALTSQLLAFGRKQHLLPEVLDMNDVISDMEPMLKRLIVENVHLTVALEPELGAVKIDPTQLEQIVVNLTVNAADAMPRGGQLTIETANLELDEHYRRRTLPVMPGEYVMLAVSDTGVGMDEATSRRIFEPFFTTKAVGKGTGLGLATVYGIVKQSGGDIWVYSEVGHGTTFKIYLPRVNQDLSSANRVPLEATAVGGGSETILLVEDDEVVRRLARVVLERAGYLVVVAENPRAAVLAAERFEGPIDLLLSDVIMPESEGPPLLLRLQARRPHLRVLYMSGYADEAVIRQGILLESTPFLQKPFTPLALTRKIREALAAPPPPALT